jgi:hypothetical protein
LIILIRAKYEKRTDQRENPIPPLPLPPGVADVAVVFIELFLMLARSLSSFSSRRTAGRFCNTVRAVATNVIKAIVASKRDVGVGAVGVAVAAVATTAPPFLISSSVKRAPPTSVVIADGGGSSGGSSFSRTTNFCLVLVLVVVSAAEVVVAAASLFVVDDDTTSANSDLTLRAYRASVYCSTNWDTVCKSRRKSIPPTKLVKRSVSAANSCFIRCWSIIVVVLSLLSLLPLQSRVVMDDEAAYRSPDRRRVLRMWRRYLAIDNDDENDENDDDDRKLWTTTTTPQYGSPLPPRSSSISGKHQTMRLPWRRPRDRRRRWWATRGDDADDITRNDWENNGRP